MGRLTFVGQKLLFWAISPHNNNVLSRMAGRMLFLGMILWLAESVSASHMCVVNLVGLSNLEVAIPDHPFLVGLGIMKD